MIRLTVSHAWVDFQPPRGRPSPHQKQEGPLTRIAALSVPCAISFWTSGKVIVLV